MSEINPALTPEEWSGFNDGGEIRVPGSGESDDSELVAGYGMFGISRVSELENGVRIGHYECTQRIHAAAALCLYGQPFGFTDWDVRALREAAKLYRVEWGENADGAANIESVADRIAALLPPRESGQTSTSDFNTDSEVME